MHSEFDSVDKDRASGVAHCPYGQDDDALRWTESHKRGYGLRVSALRQEKSLDPQ